ncbi:alpha/beta hydrolase [Rhodococcus sp. BP-149]|uniref:alpha/beta fold hydrolase n=1 Tax=unclassified Rhodococcus (in: high G+C Gram-positive bacteria) TaxID=192944 RepID=UPI001C9A4EEB|nr:MULTISPECIES: alpha/beta hydrolase [unclassified Rhodococcus (in: high G+C Gram-positive bacteria)]MBY6685674.1 alpha/beta hydrolase [Rhodococcus sp. BP-288]MBY6694778.1 alpha/beta hydrolase [Rhodococcus sp. BP-188]MBY6696624.1 alpha/beta hydrolase [Rhodococcus sp. BP-285]MBY6703280.1 alpha/beta hydrolase [Rhodococcus sp. BP-283]MBY6708603.1 alpha/beta hydrolase [Rhodococcus sp. BP-241]
MALFTLVHGAFEGAWIWQPFKAALRSLGHDVVSMDLPVDDAAAGWTEYVDAVVDTGATNGSILVAHSRAGRLVPALLHRARWNGVVLLGAAVVGGRTSPPYRTLPHPGPATSGALPAGSRDEQGRTIPTPELVRTVFADCTVEQQAWIARHLRPQCELPAPPDEQWPTVTAHYVVGADDRMVDAEWVQAACRERLDIEPIVVPGGHSLFVTHPAELAETLSGLAATDRTEDIR